MFDHEFNRKAIEILEEIKHLLKKIDARFQPKSASLILVADKGETNMPLTVTMGDKPGGAVFQELDSLGNKIAPVGNVTFSSDNPGVATVDPSTGGLGYVAPGVANISAKDDGPGGLSASDALTVLAGTPPPSVPASATLTLLPGQ